MPISANIARRRMFIAVRLFVSQALSLHGRVAQQHRWNISHVMYSFMSSMPRHAFFVAAAYILVLHTCINSKPGIFGLNINSIPYLECQ